MIPRMTTIGVLNNYRYNLNRSNNTMTKAMNTVMTGRSFNSYAEDPALATRCFQIRRSFLRTASQLDVNTALVSKYDQAWSCLDTVSQDIYDSTVTQNSTAFGSLLRSENEADASGRNALGQSLSALAKSIIQTMNGRNGENYIFGGADTLNPPFTWETKKNPAYVDLGVAQEKINEAVGKGVDLTDPESEYAKYAAAFKYIAKDGGLTNDPEAAKAGPKISLNADLTAENSADNPWYLDEDGNPTADLNVASPDVRRNTFYIKSPDTRAASIESERNRHMEEHKDDPDYDVETDEEFLNYKELVSNRYLTAEGKPTDDENEAEIYSLRENPLYNPMTEFKYLKSDGKGTNDESEAAQDLYFRGVPVDSDDYKENMEYFLKEETKNLDIGLGHKERDSEALSSTVFNSALQGIYYLGGYGTDDDGVPNNLVSIINELGTILQRCNPDNGAYASAADAERAELLAHKLEDQQAVFIQRYAEIDTKSSFLRDNGQLLTDTADSLAQQFMGLEDVDPADAITAYMYARYCYDAALKLGNSVLPQSLMDYMNF